MPGLMLLDTPSLYFRAFYGVPESVTAPDGMPVNAVRGLIDMIATLVRIHSPGGLVACMDFDWRPAFRVAAIPSYKAHRVASGDQEQIPDALAPQVPVIEEVIDAVGVARVGVPGFEADDVIGGCAARAGGPVEIVYAVSRRARDLPAPDAPTRPTRRACSGMKPSARVTRSACSDGATKTSSP